MRDWWLLGLFPALSALFLPVWLVVPKDHSGLGWVGWESIWASLTFFVQGLTYPVQILAQLLITRWGWHDLTAIWTLALPALWVAAIILWRGGQRRVLIFGLGWFGLSILPSIRLHYYPGPGSVLLWAAVCLAIAQPVRQPRRRALALGGVRSRSAACARARRCGRTRRGFSCVLHPN